MSFARRPVSSFQKHEYFDIWFKLLPDDVAHAISKKFQLYRDEFHADEV